MSTITERARAEADEAEAENPDEEPVEPITEADEEAEEVELDPSSEPSSLAVIADQEKLLDAESKRHAKALAKALGEHWGEFALCPLCQVDGYATPYQPGEVGPEQREAISVVLGDSGLQRFMQHPSEVRCVECDGWGEMRNGSRRVEQPTSACQTCMGTGHVPKPVAQAPHQVTWQPPETQYAAPIYDPSMVNADRWGRPMGHERYGLDPTINGGVW